MERIQEPAESLVPNKVLLESMESTCQEDHSESKLNSLASTSTAERNYLLPLNLITQDK